MSRRHLVMLAGARGDLGLVLHVHQIALRELAPATLILFRIGSGALALAVYVADRARASPLLRPYVVAARAARRSSTPRCRSS